ncbi:MAG: single-stranded DNA-binding protein [Candidatus Omnitrophica bacterium]|nr:single-stranded DNA-binding protein [Candidatus Omnitrophota bacterium]
MLSFNKVFLIGNLTKDPELRYTPQGTAVATLRLAVNTPFKNKEGELKQETCFINVVVWGQMAEVCNQYLQKGRLILVEGRLQSRTWQDTEGKNRSSIEIRAVRIQFMPKTFREKEEQQPIDLGEEPKEIIGEDTFISSQEPPLVNNSEESL